MEWQKVILKVIFRAVERVERTGTHALHVCGKPGLITSTTLSPDHCKE